ncbi:uncharacterized protein LOC125718422 [Brienomyrus brachyistius]|uniref:uncharacterized protein LOC125718422 n=1 Tax=Brienomyrus brachyistius TaxID=42636 RepID=UPI0020B3FD57|nr:uncharacterized protein LOC125718422 [Brienomyrus brachyistius]
MNGSPSNDSFLSGSELSRSRTGEDVFESTDTPGSASQAAHALQAAQTADAAAPIILYPVSSERVISTTTSDGKTIFKITTGPVPTMPKPPPAGSAEKIAAPEFSYQAIVFLIEAVARRWRLYGSRERAQLFQGVQQELEGQGYCMPVERIRRKWNNLIVTYKRVKDRSRETGQAKTSWEFYEMMDTMLGDTIGAQVGGSTSATLLDVGKETASANLGNDTKQGLLSPCGLAPSCVQIPTLVPASPLPPANLDLSPLVPGPPRSTGRPRARQKPRRDSGCMPAPISSPARQRDQAEECASLLRSLASNQEERSRQEEVRLRRGEAREKRRERRENKMLEALGRMATALELLSAKQDTIIALLQRLADRQ